MEHDELKKLKIYKNLKLGNLETKNIDYINNKLEDKIRDYLTEEIPKRISILLMKKLEYMYNSEYIGELIGKRIYMIVTDYTLRFNVENEPTTKK